MHGEELFADGLESFGTLTASTGAVCDATDGGDETCYFHFDGFDIRAIEESDED